MNNCCLFPSAGTQHKLLLCPYYYMDALHRHQQNSERKNTRELHENAMYYLEYPIFFVCNIAKKTKKKHLKDFCLCNSISTSPVSY